jgi:hypothetical protein
MAEFVELAKRIDRLSARALGASDDAQLLSEIEDVLAEGYIQALTGEARSRRLGTRLERLVETLDEPGAAVEARRIVLQRRSLDQKIGDLRAQLSVMREHFIRVGGGHSARS